MINLCSLQIAHSGADDALKTVTHHSSTAIWAFDSELTMSHLFNSGCCEEVVLAQLRIRQTRLTHTYKVENERPPSSELCDGSITLEHVLIECSHLTPTRKINFTDLAAAGSICKH